MQAPATKVEMQVCGRFYEFTCTAVVTSWFRRVSRRDSKLHFFDRHCKRS